MAGFSKAPVILPSTGVPANPSANGMLAWTFDPFFATASTTVPTGVGVFTAFIPNTSIVLTTANFFQIYLGSAPTATTYGTVGIYNAAGQLLAISSNTNAFGTGGVVKIALAAGVTLNAGTTYYLGFVCVYTLGTLAVWGFSSADPAALDNINIAAPASGTLGYRSQTVSGLATLPATLPAGVPTAISSSPFVGLS